MLKKTTSLSDWFKFDWLVVWSTNICEILSRRSVFPMPLGRSHVHALGNIFLVQIVRSLSEEGRVFFEKKKNSCFDFSRLILLFEWESVAKSVIIFALAPDEGRFMWVKIVKSLFWCCCYYISWRTLWTCWYIFEHWFWVLWIAGFYILL